MIGHLATVDVGCPRMVIEQAHRFLPAVEGFADTFPFLVT
jgi:hypothetical protein